jgi:DNA-binding transcriptional LysR family regulator
MDAALDWADLQLLHAIADRGSLSAAAKALSVDHTTVARRLDRPERRLGAALFRRERRRLLPTPALVRCLDMFFGMADTAIVTCALPTREGARRRGSGRPRPAP